MFNNRKNFDILKGLLIGGIAASAVSLLYAPKSGRELRKDIRKGSIKLRSDAETRFREAQKRTGKFLKRTEREFGRLRKDTETALNDILSRTNHLRETIDSRVRHIRK